MPMQCHLDGRGEECRCGSVFNHGYFFDCQSVICVTSVFEPQTEPVTSKSDDGDAQEQNHQMQTWIAFDLRYNTFFGVFIDLSAFTLHIYILKLDIHIRTPPLLHSNHSAVWFTPAHSSSLKWTHSKVHSRQVNEAKWTKTLSGWVDTRIRYKNALPPFLCNIKNQM